MMFKFEDLEKIYFHMKSKNNINYYELTYGKFYYNFCDREDYIEYYLEQIINNFLETIEQAMVEVPESLSQYLNEIEPYIKISGKLESVEKKIGLTNFMTNYEKISLFFDDRIVYLGYFQNAPEIFLCRFSNTMTVLLLSRTNCIEKIEITEFCELVLKFLKQFFSEMKERILKLNEIDDELDITKLMDYNEKYSKIIERINMKNLDNKISKKIGDDLTRLFTEINEGKVHAFPTKC